MIMSKRPAKAVGQDTKRFERGKYMLDDNALPAVTSSMSFLLARIAATVSSPFRSLLGRVNDQFEDFFLRKVAVLGRQIKYGFGDWTNFGKVSADGALMDVK